MLFFILFPAIDDSEEKSFALFFPSSRQVLYGNMFWVLFMLKTMNYFFPSIFNYPKTNALIYLYISAIYVIKFNIFPQAKHFPKPEENELCQTLNKRSKQCIRAFTSISELSSLWIFDNISVYRPIKPGHRRIAVQCQNGSRDASKVKQANSFVFGSLCIYAFS